MPHYYFDIETTGLDPEEDEIITIQTQKIAVDTGEPLGKLNIISSWEYGEEAIVKEIATIVMNPNLWDFVPVGNNLLFEFKFLENKINKYLKTTVDLEFFFSRPHIDIKPLMILANGGRFKGYHLVLNKNGSGARVPEWYRNDEYDKIIEYVKAEAESFTNFYSKLAKLMLNSFNKRIDEYV